MHGGAKALQQGLISPQSPSHCFKAVLVRSGSGRGGHCRSQGCEFVADPFWTLFVKDLATVNLEPLRPKAKGSLRLRALRRPPLGSTRGASDDCVQTFGAFRGHVLESSCSLSLCEKTPSQSWGSVNSTGTRKSSKLSGYPGRLYTCC